MKEKNRITSSDYLEITGVSRQTAYRDLDDLVSKGVLEMQGVTGKGTYYTLCKGLRKVTYDSEHREG